MLSGVLTGGKNSRLYKRLVYDLQLAQDVTAQQDSSQYGSIYMIVVTARPSADATGRSRSRASGRSSTRSSRSCAKAPPDAREVERVQNGIEASFLGQMETVAGKADQMNAYFIATGNPDYFAEDLARYQALQPTDIQAAVRRWLPADRRLELSVVPAPAQ